MSDAKLIELHRIMREIRKYVVQFGTPDVNGMYVDNGFYPKESSERFLEWLTEKFDSEGQVAVFMILREMNINYTIFVRQDIPLSVEMEARLRARLADAMGGRMGRIHSGSQYSKFPKEPKA